MLSAIKPDMVPAFETWLRGERRMSEGTSRIYVRYLKKHRDMKWIGSETLSVSSQRVRLAALLAWARYLTKANEEEELRKISRSIRHHASKVAKIVEPMRPKEIERFLAALGRLKDVEPLWVWPCVSILYRLALRAGADLVGCSKEAVRQARDAGFLAFVSKGEKFRKLPCRTVREELGALLDLPYRWGTVGEAICRGSGLKIDHPSSRRTRETAYKAIWMAVKGLAEAAGLDPATIHPHRLRHTRAMEIYRQTRDIHLVNKLLGHRFVSTTQNYLHDDRSEDLERAFRDADR